MALQLHRRGITRVRPLLGGLGAWREREYPVQARVVPLATPALDRAEGATL